MRGFMTVLIVKQLKGAGVHASGAKSHNLYPGDNPRKDNIATALQRGALAPEAWELVRTNMSRAGGGPAGRTVVTECERELADIGTLPTQVFAPGEKAVPATAMAHMVAALGKRDPMFVVTNADGNEASNMKPINEALKIRHPTEDDLYHQAPSGQVYEPLNEDACAGFAAGLALFGGRSLWLSYESFAINGWPIVQTVGQAMAELRRKTPAMVSMFTAGALEQGRNGWTHQRPEIENYIGGQVRNGNVYLLYPADANMIQAAYGWAVGQSNKCISIVASKTALPVYTTPGQAEAAINRGAVTLYESEGDAKHTIVFAVTGDMIFLPVFETKDRLEAEGYRVRIVCVANPRRLYRACDVAWSHSAEPDDHFMSQADFDALFDGDVLIGVSGGGTIALEPVMLRSRAAARDLFGWQRGETTASPAEIMAFNGITADGLAGRARQLITEPAAGNAA
jgi:phosphoketolase